MYHDTTYLFFRGLKPIHQWSHIISLSFLYHQSSPGLLALLGLELRLLENADKPQTAVSFGSSFLMSMQLICIKVLMMPTMSS